MISRRLLKDDYKRITFKDVDAYHLVAYADVPSGTAPGPEVYNTFFSAVSVADLIKNPELKHYCDEFAYVKINSYTAYWSMSLLYMSTPLHNGSGETLDKKYKYKFDLPMNFNFENHIFLFTMMWTANEKYTTYPSAVSEITRNRHSKTLTESET